MLYRVNLFYYNFMVPPSGVGRVGSVGRAIDPFGSCGCTSACNAERSGGTPTRKAAHAPLDLHRACAPSSLACCFLTLAVLGLPNTTTEAVIGAQVSCDLRIPPGSCWLGIRVHTGVLGSVRWRAETAQPKTGRRA